MLNLSRYPKQEVVIVTPDDGRIRVKVKKISDGAVTLAFRVPFDHKVLRRELLSKEAI